MKRSDVRSGFEFKVLQNLRKSGVSFQYESEKLSYTVPATSKKYTPDFIVETKTGKKIYIESKGKFDRASRVKMLLVYQQNPSKDIRILFMRDNTISKKSKTRYTQWCTERGIPCSVSENGTVPQEWLEE